MFIVILYTQQPRVLFCSSRYPVQMQELINTHNNNEDFSGLLCTSCILFNL